MRIKNFLVSILVLFLMVGAAFCADDFKRDNVEFGPYMRNLQKSIKANWKPPLNAQKSNSVILLFKISKEGKLLSHSVYKSSGSAAYDKAATDALLITPLKPLPKEFKGNSVDVQFNFDYNVWNGKKAERKADLPKAYGFEVLTENLYSTNKKLVAFKDGYKYIKVMKVNSVMPYASIMHYRIDCKNGEIGFKKIYSGDSGAALQNIEGLLNNNLIFNDTVKMQSVTKKSDNYRVYNYVCQPQ